MNFSPVLVVQYLTIYAIIAGLSISNIIIILKLTAYIISQIVSLIILLSLFDVKYDIVKEFFCRP